MSCDDVVKVTGKKMLFLGVETISWSDQQFVSAAIFAKAHNIDTLLVKAGDGTNLWYGGTAGFVRIHTLLNNQGIGCIPYFYLYGQTFGPDPYQMELTNLAGYMAIANVVCADLEAQFNGHSDWCVQMAAKMKPLPGTFLVTTFADPAEQQWMDNIKALSPAVDAWIPQQYDNYLQSVWPQFGQAGASCLLPAVNMTNEFGLNDPVQIAKDAFTEGHRGMVIWEYATAVQNTPLVNQIVAPFTAPPVDYDSQLAHAIWQSSLVDPTKLNETSGIHGVWLAELYAYNYLGAPTSPEIHTVDSYGVSVILQEFNNGFIFWYGKAHRVYGGIKI